MAAGKIAVQANDTRVYTITPEDGAADNVSITLPKEGGTVLTTNTAVPVDAVPTNESTNPVSSNGVFDALALKADTSAVNTALALKAPIASPTFTGTVGGITKSMVGLGNVDNTADSAKSVNYATSSGSCTGNSATATTATKSSFLGAGSSGATCDAMFKSVAVNSSGWNECNGVADAPNTGWWFIHSIRHSNASNYWGTQLAYGWEGNPSVTYQRNISAGVWSAWKELGGMKIKNIANFNREYWNNDNGQSPWVLTLPFTISDIRKVSIRGTGGTTTQQEMFFGRYYADNRDHISTSFGSVKAINSNTISVAIASQFNYANITVTEYE